ncbi:MAG TPA: hypothetical protein VEK11_12930 [Thermoanaerobaculia bacterium]|nr:hypothetical protein [Thermoanaerobaculia bacterium]
MRKLWIWLALVLLGIGAALFFGRSRVETGTANRPWPLDLGVVADAPKRFPPVKDNASATQLYQLASEAEVELRQRPTRRGPEGMREELRDEFAEYVRVQIERSGDTIDAPPADVARYLTENAATLNAIRTLALSGTPIVFEADLNTGREDDFGPILTGPSVFALQHLHRVFVARALTSARDGNAAAWDELRTTWELTRPLWGRPDQTAVLGASTAARMVNGAARKMPLPPPAWLAELDTTPYEWHLAAAHQAEAWRSKSPALNERLRGMAAEVLQAKACDASSPQFDAVREKLGARATPNLISHWERLMRFRAEREARRNVLRIRAGQPPVPDTQCTDGSWEVTPSSFRFTRDVPVPRPQIKYPLGYDKTQPGGTGIVDPGSR